jgi:hypothetical protein
MLLCFVYQELSLQDLKLFERHASSVLPDDVRALGPCQHQAALFLSNAMNRLNGFHMDTERQRLSADLEIRLRNVYLDLDQRQAEAVMKDIYRHVTSYEDMQFLVKHASQVLPPSPEQARDGAAVARALGALQQDLTEKRKVCTSTYFCAFKISAVVVHVTEPHRIHHITMDLFRWQSLFSQGPWATCIRKYARTR